MDFSCPTSRPRITVTPRAALRLARARVLCSKCGTLPPPSGTHFFCFYRIYCVYQNSEVSSSRLVSSLFLLQRSRFHKLHITKKFTSQNCGPLKTAGPCATAPIAPPKLGPGDTIAPQSSKLAYRCLKLLTVSYFTPKYRNCSRVTAIFENVTN